MIVYVTTLTNRVNVIENVHPFDSVMDIKKKIYDKEEIDVKKQILYFDRMRLENIMLLSDYDIEDGAVLVLIFNKAQKYRLLNGNIDHVKKIF